MKKSLFLTMCVILLLTFAGLAMAKGDIVAGKEKATSCAGCHGAHGEGMSPNPPIAGLDEAYFTKQLQDFKSGSRVNGMMTMFTKPLSNQDMENLAAYYFSLKVK